MIDEIRREVTVKEIKEAIDRENRKTLETYASIKGFKLIIMKLLI